MISLVEDPENHSYEELVGLYLESGFDRESAEAYASMLKFPPEGLYVD